MTTADNATVMRLRSADAQAAAARNPAEPQDGPAAILVTTTVITTYPTAALAFYAVLQTLVDGSETEGTIPTFTTVGDPFLAVNLGSAVPALGTRVLIRQSAGKWIFRYD